MTKDLEQIFLKIKIIFFKKLKFLGEVNIFLMMKKGKKN